MTAGLFSLLTSTFSCARGTSSHDAREWFEQLRLGMSKDEVRTILGEPKLREKLSFPGEYYRFRRGDVVPHDLLRDIPEGIDMWVYQYWVTVADKKELSVFFSQDGRVLGWAKDRGPGEDEKFEHERLTSALEFKLTENEVRKRIGKPDGTAKRPDSLRGLSRELLVDHYWNVSPLAACRT